MIYLYMPNSKIYLERDVMPNKYFNPGDFKTIEADSLEDAKKKLLNKFIEKANHEAIIFITNGYICYEMSNDMEPIPSGFKDIILNNMKNFRIASSWNNTFISENITICDAYETDDKITIKYKFEGKEKVYSFNPYNLMIAQILDGIKGVTHEIKMQILKMANYGYKHPECYPTMAPDNKDNGYKYFLQKLNELSPEDRLEFEIGGD